MMSIKIKFLNSVFLTKYWRVLAFFSPSQTLSIISKYPRQFDSCIFLPILICFYTQGQHRYDIKLSAVRKIFYEKTEKLKEYC